MGLRRYSFAVQLGRQRVCAPAHLVAGPAQAAGSQADGAILPGTQLFAVAPLTVVSSTWHLLRKPLADALISRNEAPLLSCSLDVSSTTQTGKTKKSQGVRLGLGRIGGRLQGCANTASGWARCMARLEYWRTAVAKAPCLIPSSHEPREVRAGGGGLHCHEGNPNAATLTKLQEPLGRVGAKVLEVLEMRTGPFSNVASGGWALSCLVRLGE